MYWCIFCFGYLVVYPDVMVCLHWLVWFWIPSNMWGSCVNLLPHLFVFLCRDVLKFIFVLSFISFVWCFGERRTNVSNSSFSIFCLGNVCARELVSTVIAVWGSQCIFNMAFLFCVWMRWTCVCCLGVCIRLYQVVCIHQFFLFALHCALVAS